MKLTFLGANRNVTGSRYCLEAAGTKLMIDCGMVQEREFLSRNWDVCPIPGEQFEAMLLTHVHIDHCGLIPKFAREGFDSPIYATRPSVDLAEIMLRDAAKIQEEDAAYKKRRHSREGRRGRHPEVPLFTERDVERVLPLLKPIAYGKPLKINKSFSVTFHDAGHILGSAMLEIDVVENGNGRKVIFSGDIGQWDRPLVRDPTTFTQADYVVMESTYGDRDHIDGGDVIQQLADVINRTVQRGGNVVIPTFAVERAQQLMYYISRLAHRDRIPDVPVFLDSPMAVDVTDVYHRHLDSLDDEATKLFFSGEPPLRFPGLRMVRDVEESKAINRVNTSCIIMSASGMCTAGRIKHHLRQNIGRRESTILFVGYQGRGTLGRQILDGNRDVRIHGRSWRVKAEIAQIHGFSGHADRTELLRWLTNLKQPPQRVFLTHGEEQVALDFASTIQQRTTWPVHVPSYEESVELA